MLAADTRTSARSTSRRTPSRSARFSARQYARPRRHHARIRETSWLRVTRRSPSGLIRPAPPPPRGRHVPDEPPQELRRKPARVSLRWRAVRALAELQPDVVPTQISSDASTNRLGKCPTRWIVAVIVLLEYGHSHDPFLHSYAAAFAATSLSNVVSAIDTAASLARVLFATSDSRPPGSSMR
jgi:hypothetical protein